MLCHPNSTLKSITIWLPRRYHKNFQFNAKASLENCEIRSVGFISPDGYRYFNEVGGRQCSPTYTDVMPTYTDTPTLPFADIRYQWK